MMPAVSDTVRPKMPPMLTYPGVPAMRRSTILTILFALGIPISASAQNTGQVTGTVTSDQRQPLGGVTVSVQGTALRAVSGADGRYVISNVPEGRQIVQATSIGYAAQNLTLSIAANATSVANFQLVSEAIALGEVVVVGYGTQRREQITGAVASVTADKFVAGPTRDAAALITGRMA